ncbi:hypothetical protein [Xylanimonas ulmi]|uniref:Maltooligosyltrehalose trehalohydrolase n=1 Tax=Xylanimonas ulmi TaxID=228973 RepID=A0A4Q7M1F2_9MICO|nr:hypothetical protein [Xylanibacterium ulmi]RZS61061.1 maltooligosyltrehalose trehalohydrolase [Xylanibacterium ulmi]
MSTGSRPPQPGPTVSWPGPRPIVWAPRARTVDVVVPGPDGAQAHPLRLVGAHKPGYWGADRELDAGTRFGYSIDGRPALADPTGTAFPEGVHGLSRVPTPLSGWSDDAWRPPDITGGVLLHLDVATATRAGTLDAAASLLPDIAALGIHGVELAPLAAYDPDVGPTGGVRLFAVHEPLGGVLALARFVDAAHAHGLAVVLTPPHRWAVCEGLGLETFGPYAVDGRLNLSGSGSRGVRDFLLSDAERWFADLHVDGLSLDVEALADGSPVPWIAELAEATVTVAQEVGRGLTLFVDGPGRSDRLTGALSRVLEQTAPPNPATLDQLRRLAKTLTPTARLPLRADRLVRRRHPTTAHAASIVVGDLTRLPGARRTMPWAPPGAPHAPADPDTRATTLAFAMLAGTPLVLDTDHAPVGQDSPASARLLAWCARLAALRADAAGELALDVDLRSGATTLAVRRGRLAVVLGWDGETMRAPLEEVAPGPAARWELAAAWSPDSSLDERGLLVPPGATVVLRARA